MPYQKFSEIPKLLKDLSDPPKQLYYLAKEGFWTSQNNVVDIFENCVAVVGSRRMTDYGRRVLDKLIPQLVFEKKTIVSGFMYGTDQYAHQVCIDNGGKTIAVLGWGIDKKLFDYDKKLAEQIVNSGGLLISEWETQEGTNWTFPVRDRIIAALAAEVFITEAAEKSGSLITANQAIKLKRKVWAVPGPITSKTSVGTNNLIADGKAKMWLPGVSQTKLNIDNPLLVILENEALSTDELARKVGRSIVEIGAELSILLLSGKVIERGGKYYIEENVD